jgi:hypothetical protein
MFWATCTDGSSWSWIGEKSGGGRCVRHSNRVGVFFGNKRRRKVRRRVIVITIREIQWRIIINWQGLARQCGVVSCICRIGNCCSCKWTCRWSFEKVDGKGTLG